MRILKEASLQNHVEVDEKKVVVYLRKTDDEDMLCLLYTSQIALKAIENPDGFEKLARIAEMARCV